MNARQDVVGSSSPESVNSAASFVWEPVVGHATIDGVALAREINEAFTVLLEVTDDPATHEQIAHGLDAARTRLTLIEGEDRVTAYEIMQALGSAVLRK